MTEYAVLQITGDTKKFCDINGRQLFSTLQIAEQAMNMHVDVTPIDSPTTFLVVRVEPAKSGD